jgi:hypothetical protein
MAAHRRRLAAGDVNSRGDFEHADNRCAIARCVLRFAASDLPCHWRLLESDDHILYQGNTRTLGQVTLIF